MSAVTRFQEIRETQMKLLGIKSQDTWMVLYREKTGQVRNKITLWYWEKDESDPQYRPPHIRYLKFLCEEFNYNPEYILGIVDEPVFNDSCKADDFPELDRILETVNKYPVLALALRKLLFKTDVGLIKDLHLQIFHKHPELYDEFKNLVHTVEKHPELFDLLTKFKLPPC